MCKIEQKSGIGAFYPTSWIGLPQGAFMPATLFPGSVVTESCVYRISHSTAHHPDTHMLLLQDLILPECPAPGCSVSYSPVKPGQVNRHRQAPKTDPKLDLAA